MTDKKLNVWEWIGFGAHRIELEPTNSWKEREERSKVMLARVLDLGTTVAVVGNGCSRPLGYPDWKGLTRAIVNETKRLTEKKTPSITDQNRLERFEEYLEEENAKPEDLMFFISTCKRILETNKERKFDKFIDDTFNKEKNGKLKSSKSEDNPYKALLELPIKRFITTNYDHEIEHALKNYRKIHWNKFGLSRDVPIPELPLSFTQKPEYCDQLALFALARVRHCENMIFHCHGRYDDPDSVIASEADYQRWYLGEHGGAGPVFQQTIELLLQSNPLLFVGYGLGDEDLLRPLRHLGALNPKHKHSRPIFALIACSKSKDEQDHFEYLFERYGLNVITYSAPNSNTQSVTPEAWGQALNEALMEIKAYWEKTRYDWLYKPVFRRTKMRFKPPEEYRRFSVKDPECITSQKKSNKGSERNNGQEKSKPARREIDELVSIVEYQEKRVRVLGLTGPQGSGKTWHALHLLNELKNGNDAFQGYFYWDASFSNDALTALDELVDYLNRDENRNQHSCTGSKLTESKSRFERLRDSITKGRYLIILDAFERLLRIGNTPHQGRPYGPNCEELLRIINDPESQSTVILVSSLLPEMLFAKADQSDEYVRKYVLSRLDTGNIKDHGQFKDCDRINVSVLCGLLDGHIFGITLADRFLSWENELNSEEEKGQNLESLVKKLASKPQDRLGALVDIVLNELDKSHNDLPIELLKCLAFFSSPVDEDTLKVCYSLIKESQNGCNNNEREQEHLVKALVRNHLLLEIVPEHRSGESTPPPPYYSVHLAVRYYLIQEENNRKTDVLPSFGLAGITSGKIGIRPESPEASRLAFKLFDKLYERAKEECDKAKQECDKAEQECDKAKQECCNDNAARLARRMYSLLRSRMDFTAIPSWCTYDEYIRYNIRLVALCRQVSPCKDGLWDYRGRKDLPSVTSEKGVLYPSELAWLCNNLALGLLTEGQIPDAYMICEQLHDINQLIEGQGEADQIGEYRLQSLLNLSYCFIEFGQLPRAWDYLHEVERLNDQIGDEDFAARVLGYKALVEHYQGNLEISDKLFEEAVNMLRKNGGNKRGESLFLWHHANLKLRLGDKDNAQRLQQSALALAQSEHQSDLQAYIKLAEGYELVENDQLPKARMVYNTVLHEARRHGIYRLEAMTCSALARLARRQGDAMGSKQLALRALTLANELGLGLLQTDCLINLGRAMVEVDQRSLGVAYLKHARKLADDQNYWLRSRKIERCLHEMHESNEDRELFI